jgi:hypothetical protein
VRCTTSAAAPSPPPAARWPTRMGPGRPAPAACPSGWDWLCLRCSSQCQKQWVMGTGRRKGAFARVVSRPPLWPDVGRKRDIHSGPHLRQAPTQTHQLTPEANTHKHTNTHIYAHNCSQSQPKAQHAFQSRTPNAASTGQHAEERVPSYIYSDEHCVTAKVRTKADGGRKWMVAGRGFPEPVVLRTATS